VERCPSTTLGVTHRDAAVVELGDTDQKIGTRVASTECDNGLMLQEQKRWRRGPACYALANL